jgi:hypothetical protein
LRLISFSMAASKGRSSWLTSDTASPSFSFWAYPRKRAPNAPVTLRREAA